MNNNSTVKTFLPPEINRAEICRYAGAYNQTDMPLLEECIAEAQKVLTYNVCFCEVPVNFKGKILDLSFCQAESENLSNTLAGCKKAVLFAASVGIGIDRLIIANRIVSPAKSLIFDALGSERAEALANAFQATFKNTTPRFSPGYGDFPLTAQKDVFLHLAPENKIGLTLNNQLLMSPAKSVTAIFGLKESR